MSAHETCFFMSFDSDQAHIYQIQDQLEKLKVNNSVSIISIDGLQDVIQNSNNKEQIQAQFVDKLCQTQLYWKCVEFTISYCMSNVVNSMKVINKLADSCRFLLELELNNNHIGDQGAQAIAKAHWKFINSLSLEDTRLTHKGLKILSSHQWRFLHFFNLSNNNLTNRGLNCLAQNKAWKNLTTLRIQNIGLTSDGIKLLKKSCWFRLCSLTIGRQEGGSEVLKTISKSGFDGLKYVYFQSKGYCYPGCEAKIKSHVDYDGVVFRRIPLLIYHNSSDLRNESLEEGLTMKKLVVKAADFRTMHFLGL